MAETKRFAARAMMIAVGAVTAAMGGRAVAFDRTFNITRIGGLDPLGAPGTTNNIYSDLWADGNLVVLGSVTGTGSSTGGRGVTIMDNSNPAAPTLLSYYNPAGTAGGQFRDVLVKGNVGYFAIDDPASVGGLDIVNLTNPASPVKISNINAGQNGFARNHDLFIDSHYLYIASNQVTTVKVFDIAVPTAPVFVRNIVTTGVATEDLHDMTVKNGRMYTSNLVSGLVEIYDISDVGSGGWTTATRRLGSFNPGLRQHSTWPSEDGKLLAIAREDDNADVQLWDISNPAAAVLKSTLNRTNVGIDSHSPHDPVIIGDTLYVSWYQAGLQIFNIRNPANPIHLGAYDTFVGGDGNANSFIGYDGNWGVFPHFGKDKILLSDFDAGLITVNATDAFRQVWTYPTNSAGRWQDNVRWDSGAGPFPDSSDMTASFTAPAANRTVTVDGALSPTSPRVGTIEILSSLDYTITGANAGEIEMKSSSGPAAITTLAPFGSAVASRINCPLNLSSDLLVTNNGGATAAPTLEISSLKDAASRSVTFAGSGNTALVSASPSFTGSFIVSGGTLTLRDGGATNGQGITLAGGTLALENNASTNFASNVNVTANAGLSVGDAGISSGQMHALGNVNIAAGKTLTLTCLNGAHFASPSVTSSGTLKIAPGAGAAAARLGGLTIPAGGKLDLGDSSVVLTSADVGSWNGATYTGVTGLVKSGRNGGGWGGSGIVTSQPTAIAGNLTTIGVATADQIGRAGGTFGGISVATGDVLAMYTYGGDANLDGKINVDDYTRIDFNVQLDSTGWFNGDFNYDGKIDVDDYTIIDFNVVVQGAPFATASAAPAGTSNVTAIPEPGAGLLLCGAPFLLSHTRRRRRA